MNADINASDPCVWFLRDQPKKPSLSDFAGDG